MTEERFHKVKFAYWFGIIGSIFLAALKGLFGFLSGSKALIADALYSLLTVGSSIALLLGVRALERYPGEAASPKLGRAESIAAFIVSIALIIIGLEIGLTSLKAMYTGVDSPPQSFAIVAIATSILIQEMMFQYKIRLGKKLSSPMLMANANEHRKGRFCSAIVLIGVFGALLGDYLGNKSMYILDPIASTIVAVLVVIRAYRLIMGAIQQTFERVLHDEEVAELLRTVQVVKGVIAVDHLRAREQGHYVIVDMSISVNPRISVLEGQDIAKTVKQILMKRHIHVSDVCILVKPYDAGYPYNNVDSEQDSFSSVLH